MRTSNNLPADEEALLRYWHRKGQSDHRIAEKMGDGWNHDRVRYYRLRLGLKQNGYQDLECGTLAETRDFARRAFAAKHGWGHLLPSVDEDTGEAIHGHELTRAQTQILTILADNGQMTIHACIVAMKRRSALLEGRSIFAALARAGLIVQDGQQGNRPLFRLADGIKRHERSIRPDGIDLRIAGFTYKGKSALTESETEE